MPAAGEVSIAYRVFGSGPLDLVFVSGLACHVEIMWEFGRPRRFLDCLAAFSRVILFDRSRMGCRIRSPNLPTLKCGWTTFAL